MWAFLLTIGVIITIQLKHYYTHDYQEFMLDLKVCGVTIAVILFVAALVTLSDDGNDY